MLAARAVYSPNMDALKSAIDTFFSFPAYVMLPIIIFLIALIVRMKLKEAVIATIRLAAGFAGVFIAFDFFVSQIAPAVQSLMEIRGIDFPVLDVGWPPLAAITWSNPIAPLSIPLVIGLNMVLLAFGLTRTLYIDIWNYWHFALLGVLVNVVTGSLWLGILATLILAVYAFKMVEWTAHDVQREVGIPGVSASPVSVNGIIPYTVLWDRIFDAIPGIRRIDYNPGKKKGNRTDLLGEPMVIGILIGLVLGIAAGYNLKQLLTLAVNIAAVMFLLPKSAALIGEGMTPVTQHLRTAVEKRFPSRSNLVVALDTGILMHHRSVTVTGLLLMPIAIGLSLILPGNKVLPLGDLPNLISVMSLSVLLFRGNVFRAVISGIPLLVGYLYISSSLAPFYTDLADEVGAVPEGAGLITAFTDGGHHVRYLLLEAFQGRWWAIVACVAVLGLVVLTWQRYRTMTQAQVEETDADLP